jgi:S-adenosylmethionine hydrolase
VNKTLILISDYGTGDPAFTEVILRLRNLLPDVFIHPQSTPPFSTINTGFWLYQVALTPNIKNTYIFSNTAPRKDKKKAQANNKGEILMYARLKNGFELVGINAGYNFSFIKPCIEKFHHVVVENEGSQFRSRDKYPQAVYKMIKKDKSFIGAKEDVNIIPDAPSNIIASIDGYGNIKTTIRASSVSFKPGQMLTVEVNKKKHVATYTDGTFNIVEGELAFAPGSSGHDDRFMELFLRGGSAEKLFDNPEVESEIKIKES